MLTLSDIIARRREEIVQRFANRWEPRSGVAESPPREQVINSLRGFLDELAEALRPGCDRDAAQLAAEQSASAAKHGQQRFRMGYEIGALVREYGGLQELLFDVIEESAVAVSGHEARIIAQYLTSGIAEAVVEYGAIRDEELRRQTAEHIGFLAHELRNPLGSVKLALDLMLERGDIRPSPASATVKRSLNRLSALIDDSLVHLRLQQTEDIDCAPLDAREFLTEIAQESAAELEMKDLRLGVEGHASFRADRKVLRSAVSNLVRNAVKFTPRGGRIQLRAKQADDRVVIEVEDSCGGLPRNKIQKLFDTFVQAGPDRSGFGLGLAITKQAAEAHSGEVRVQNLPGKGCIFVLDLPNDPVKR